MLYSLALYLYTFCALVAAIFNKKIRTLIKGQVRTFGILRTQIKRTDRIVWFHAASLGEFEQGRPLMERLRKTHPEYKILLTFFSPSGYEVRKNYDGADVICYMPFDTPGNVASFLRLAHPEIAIFIKYEFWHNYLYFMKRKGIKLYSVSSIFRPQQHFFKWYGSANVLRCFTRLFVQNEVSRELLRQQGIDNVSIVGDTRFDRVLDIRNQAAPLPLVEIFKDGKSAFIAGSSWQPDEQIYVPYFNAHKEWKLIIAPHVIGEHHLTEIYSLLEGRKVVRYTEMERYEGDMAARDALLKEAEVLIVDCFGKLSSIYRYGNAALVGGGFGVGIHNVPEAAVYGIPVLFGPNNKKFQEAQHLLKCGGSFEYTDYDSFASLMDGFIANPKSLEEAGRKAGEYISHNAGAADKCFHAIFG
ncbi:MAG: 3-deoxy-D-manno-octulosonic acid transferase [Bacteroides sp.]|nr:3-deoxy-D-manno-octulosonic acid transferase [Bacteroides sp.]MCM1421989.1 3-deoxy-D-manno-octulosonic acid transferase [Bacteroides sp.]